MITSGTGGYIWESVAGKLWRERGSCWEICRIICFPTPTNFVTVYRSMESTSVVSFVTRIGVTIDFSELFPTAKSAATISERKKRLIVNSPLNLCWWVAVL